MSFVTILKTKHSRQPSTKILIANNCNLYYFWHSAVLAFSLLLHFPSSAQDIFTSLIKRIKLLATATTNELINRYTMDSTEFKSLSKFKYLQNKIKKEN